MSPETNEFLSIVGGTLFVVQAAERKTGADFALVLALVEGDRKRYFASIVQAKLAKSSWVNVDRKAGESTQLERLYLSGIGQYLFYNTFDELALTGMSAVLVKDTQAKNCSTASALPMISPCAWVC